MRSVRSLSVVLSDEIMNPQHFGWDTADIRIRIRINLEIRICFPDHFWLRLDSFGGDLRCLSAVSFFLYFVFLYLFLFFFTSENY